MPKLGDTVAQLAAFSRQSRTSSAPPNPQALSLRRIDRFGPNPGDLTMLIHHPDTLSAPAPLVVVLHGCTQKAGDYASTSGWLMLADRLGFAVLAPEQHPGNNPNRCFNWFEPDDVRRGSGEAASIRSMIQHMILDGSVDPNRVFITGLSAGGAMCAALLALYPETFAGGAVVAGLPFGAARNLQEALSAMSGAVKLSGRDLASRLQAAAPADDARPRLSIWHGDADHTVASSNARLLAEQYVAHYGLAGSPDGVFTRGRRTRAVWLDAAGEPVVELNLIAGLAHGTPVSASGDEPVGQVAPFSLEAGIGSSLEIARFWGLAPRSAEAEQESGGSGRRMPGPQEETSTSLGRTVMSAISPHVSPDVRDVIAKALSSAGLRT